MQIFGIFSPFVLIFEMGLISLLFTLGLILFGTWWYFWYAQEKVERVGAIYHIFERMVMYYYISTGCSIYIADDIHSIDPPIFLRYEELLDALNLSHTKLAYHIRIEGLLQSTTQAEENLRDQGKEEEANRLREKWVTYSEAYTRLTKDPVSRLYDFSMDDLTLDDSVSKGGVGDNVELTV